MALTAEFSTYTHEGNIPRWNHKIEIIDTDGDISGEFACTFENTMDLIDEGESRSAWQLVQGKTLRFRMIIEDAVHDDFINELSKGLENRFIVRHSVAGFNPWFVGIIFMDEVTVYRSVDIKSNGVIKRSGYIDVVAIDAITTLDGYDFEYSQIVYSSISEVIGKCLSYLPTASYLFPSPWAANVYWEADVGSGTTFLDAVHYNSVVDSEANRNGGRSKISALEVLTRICERYDARIYQAAGVYIFEQLSGKVNKYITGTVGYNIDGTVGTPPTFLVGSKLPLCSSITTILDADIRTFKPPLNSVTINYEFSFNPNITSEKFYSLSATGETCDTNLIRASVKNDTTRIRFIGSVEYHFISVGGFTGQVRPVFWFEIKVGTQYYVREPVTAGKFYYNTYKKEEWTTTPGKYYFSPGLSTMPDRDYIIDFAPIYFSTLPLDQSLDGEQFSLCFGMARYDRDNNSLSEGEVIMNAILDDLDTTFITVDNQVVEQVTQTFTAPGETENTLNIEKTIYVSDGPNDSSQNRHHDGMNPVESATEWTAAGLGTYPHIELLAYSVLSRGIEKQEYFEGTICGYYLPFINGIYDNKEWIWIKGSWTVSEAKDLFRGEMLNAKTFSTQVTTGTLVEKYDLVDRPPFPNGGDAADIGLHRTPVTGITGTTLNADTYGIPMPDTTNWDEARVADIVFYSKNGVDQEYKEDNMPGDIWDFYWDNAARNFVFAENQDFSDRHIFRIFKAGAIN